MQPQFESLEAFLNMGGYAFFVWLAFVVTFAAMALLTMHTFYVKAMIKQTVAKEQARAERILEARNKRQENRRKKSQETNTEVETDKL